MKNKQHRKPMAMTKNKIASLKVLDSYEYLRLLTNNSGIYYVFSNYGLNTMYSNNYYTARQFFEQEANKLD